MIRRLPAAAGLLLGCLAIQPAAIQPAAIQPAGAQTPEAIEPPLLQHAIATGEMPPSAKRLPETPAVVSLTGPLDSPGLHGGTLRMLMGRQKDIRMMVVYGYARLVGYTADLELEPDILRDIEVEDNRVFTLHLRPGHKWSDGAPFTAEDFRFWWEDVIGNEELSSFGPPADMLVDGEPPVFEVLDETTVRYTWSKPNPKFLPALAGARPLFIYSPAHYLKQFHKGYADPQRLARRVARAGERDWTGLLHRMDRPYRSDNPDFPVLQPWVNTTSPPSERYIFERNPYYHRVDPAGRQLPYIDRVAINIADARLVPAKAAAGESDLQARHLALGDYTILKEGEARNNFKVRLWRTGGGSEVALFPNLNVKDPVWRELLRDVRFRRALSLAINRYELNQVIYYGLGHESANTILPRSPLYKTGYAEAWAEFDLERANAMLDEIGLTERDDRGIRLLPDGRPAGIIVETAGESTETTDVLELIQDSWGKAGIKLYIRPSQRDVFRSRVFSGQAMMAVWSGLINAIPTASTNPEELAPTSQYQYQWPDWGLYTQSGGEAGAPPELPAARRLLELHQAWLSAPSEAAQREIWHEMLSIYTDQVFSIGTVNAVPTPVVVNAELRNVPKEALYNWAPTSYFGAYRPDTFWFGSMERRVR